MRGIGILNSNINNLNSKYFPHKVCISMKLTNNFHEEVYMGKNKGGADGIECCAAAFYVF
jgi:hypothetical protein